MNKLKKFFLGEQLNIKILTKKELEKYEKKLDIENYYGDPQSDYDYEIYEELVEKNKAFNICRGKISKKYIYKIFNYKNTYGHIIYDNNELIGFIIYHRQYKNQLFLDLICVSQNNKGKYIGQILLNKMEEYSINNKIKIINAEIDKNLFKYYKLFGWKKYKKSKNNMIFIRKKIKK